MEAVNAMLEQNDLEVLDNRYVGFKQYNADKAEQTEERHALGLAQVELITKMNILLAGVGILATAAVGLFISVLYGA